MGSAKAPRQGQAQLVLGKESALSVSISFSSLERNSRLCQF